MHEEFKSNIDRSLPFGWPAATPLPTVEEAEEAVRRGERAIVQTLDDLKDKLGGPTPEMLNTIITI